MKRRIISILAICSAMGLAGCAQRPAVPINTPITAAELAPYRKAGSATVVGRAYLRRQDAAAVTCAGQQVLLIPAIAYNRAMIAALRAGQKPVPGPNVGTSESYWKKSVCDARGRFRFRNVPAGPWYVSIAVRWKEPPEQGAVVKEVRVPAAGTVGVVLTDSDLVR
jgi:hypothetical protein